MYRTLALIYKYTPNQISDMTPLQQIALANMNVKECRKFLSINTYEEVLAYQASKSNG